MRPRFIQKFQADFAQFVKADEPFAFVRFHDGEYAVIQGISYQARSGWSVDSPTWLQYPLQEALEANLDGFYIGISPPCDHSEAAAFYRGQIKCPKQRLTFATIFQHSNFKKTPQLLRHFQNPFVVSCKHGDVTVPQNGVRKGWDIDAVVRKLLKVESRPILVAAGPCANVIIHRYWKTQDPDKRVTIIDIGSALDLDVHGKRTRPYHDPQAKASQHHCDWDTWHAFQPLVGKRRERAMKRAAQNEVFAQLHDAGFKGTTGSKDGKTQIHRRAAKGIRSPAVRDRATTNSGNRNVRIRPSKKKR